MSFPTSRTVNKESKEQVIQAMTEYLRVFCSKSLASEVQKSLRVREVEFASESGHEVFRLYLEWDKASESVDTRVGISIDLCMQIHAFLNERILGIPGTIEVSSPGVEPPLRSLGDFEEALGAMVKVDTWAKIDGRNRFVMHLKSVDKDRSVLILAEGKRQFEVSLESIKLAFALWYHSETPISLREQYFRRFAH